MISFSTIDDNYREAFYSIMCEYLPGSDTDTVKSLEAMWPKAFVCCVNSVLGLRRRICGGFLYLVRI